MSGDTGTVEGGIGAATLRGVRWTFVGRIIVEVSSFLASIVLARLIAPAEFGQAAIALVVVSLAIVLAPQGFGALLVRMDNLRQEHLETASFLSLASGLLLAGLTLLCVPFVVQPIFGHTTAVLVAIVSPVWILSALTTTPLVTLQRRMDFRKLALIELVARSAGSAVSVACAIAGLNASAIIIGWLVFSAVSAAGYVMATPPVFPHLDVPAAKEIASFGAAVSLSSLVYTAFRNVDYALVGARLGPAALGFYWRAYQLGIDYQSKITIIMQRVSFPVYSRSGDLESMRRFRLRIARMHAVVILPILGLLAVTAPVAIPFLFGDQWHSTVVPTQILTVAGMATALSAGAGPLFVAAGKPVTLLVVNTVSLVLYAATIYFLAPYGLTTVCIAVSIFTVLSTTAVYAVMGRLLSIPLRAFALEILPAVVSTAILYAAAWPVAHGLADQSPVVDIIASTLVAAVAYALVLKYLFPAAFADVRFVVGRLVRRLGVS